MGQAQQEGLSRLTTNGEIAARLLEMATLLELKGLEGFKLRAYHRAAQSIENHPIPLVDLHQQGKLREVRGVGEGLARKIAAIIETGTCPQLEELRAEVPATLIELMRVPGLGPKTVAMVWRELGVSTLEQLEAAASDGRLAGLRGLGPKRAQSVLAGIASLRTWAGRTPIAEAKPIADAIVRELGSYPEVTQAEAAGSLRRGRETVGDLDILVATDQGPAVLERFAGLADVQEVIALGETKASVRMRGIAQVDVRAVSAGEYPAALVYFTGSKEHNVRLREIAKARGLKLNEYGLFPEDGGTAVAAPDEAAIYAALGMAYVPPELREDQGEIAAAQSGDLPVLVAASDVRGDLHSHTTWSDGTDDLTTMATQAMAVGVRYLAVTDHSQTLAFAGGLTPARLRKQAGEIAAWNATHGDQLRLLRGCEVEILADGTLDLPDDVLAELEWVVAAVHSPNRRGGLSLTARLVAAARHPLVDVIAHPTGQIIGEREAYDVDVAELIDAAAVSGVALEINASPYRLDLPPHLARQAARQGVKLVVSTDSHDARSLGDLWYGVTAARRGWLTAADVLNTLDLQGLAAWRDARRQRHAT